jgi:hypothetical protein
MNNFQKTRAKHIKFKAIGRKVFYGSWLIGLTFLVANAIYSN